MALYKLAIYTYPEGRAADARTTNLEYEVLGGLGTSVFDLITDDLVTALSGLFLTSTVIDRAVWSTWDADSEPYDPTKVRTIPVGINGARGGTGLGGPVDDTLTLLIRKEVETGRIGRIFLPFCLYLGDLVGISGKWRLIGDGLTYLTTQVSNLEAALNNTGECVLAGKVLLDTIYPAVAAGVKQVVQKVYSDAPIVRAVTGLTLVDPTERQENQ